MLSYVLALTLVGVVFGADPYCQHGGTFECTCPYGYYGANCEKRVDFCNSTEIVVNGEYQHIDICGIHGSCQNTQYGPNCICNPGWYGTYCQHDYNNCTSNPCEHGGTCSNEAGFDYECNCPPLYTGKDCEQQIDFCHLHVINATTHQTEVIPICGEHGTCVTHPSGFRCNCDWGWNGQFCENRIKWNCTHKGHTYPHNSTWQEGCDTCICEYGTVECSHSFWCPQKCAIYETQATVAAGVKVGCPLYENCVPKDVTCAHETPNCTNPVGWCFPVGYVLVDTISIPTNSPHGWRPWGN